MKSNANGSKGCPCCNPDSVARKRGLFDRRSFIQGAGTLAVGGLAASPIKEETVRTVQGDQQSVNGVLLRQPLKVQPVLTYRIPQRREATSWREWGGIQSEESLAAEKERIGKELQHLSLQTDFPLEIRGLETVSSVEQAAPIAHKDHDVMVLFGAGGNVKILEALTHPDKWNLLFLRHQSGPVYLWYEIAHPRYLRKTVDEYGQPGMTPHDVVVDKVEELAIRFRALYGLKNSLGKKIVAVGGASGWGQGGRQAPDISRNLWKMDLIDYPYTDLGPRLKNAKQNSMLTRRCQEEAESQLRQPGVELRTTRSFLYNSFILRDVLKEIMAEAKTDAITINSCMGTIMPISETTACMPLSLLNDEGYLAFCESDFVVIPSGVLLHYISGKPVFLNDPTYPHDQIVTLAHCTAPRKMDGRNLEPVKILTHFESDYGAAPKVEMKVGAPCTNLIPDFACKQWTGFLGAIVANPFMDICRSQIDVRIQGNQERLIQEMKGFHWMMSYGDYLRETDYALKKVGITFLNLSSKT